MKYEDREIHLPEGIFNNELLFYEEKDKKVLKKYLDDWVKHCKDTINLIGGTRTPNLSEAFSEAVFSIEMGMPRCVKSISGSSSSFDLYDLKRKKRIQLKAASSFGPSSFGPRSEYDEVYFLFFREIAEGKKYLFYSGKYEIYKLNPDDFPSLIMNKKKNETFEDQQKQGKRPRFSIPKTLIDPHSVKPVRTGNVDLW
tara:strand:- start:57 stop:650 length:594 start_codon:yes stop_codon:yes gene_type:complete